MFTHNETDESIARNVVLVLENDQYACQIMRNACRESVLNDDAATGDPAYTYEAAMNGKYETWRTLVECAGLSVSDAVAKLCHAQSRNTAYLLLLQVLDFGNKALWAEVAESFMPDVDEVLEFFNQD